MGKNAALLFLLSGMFFSSAGQQTATGENEERKISGFHTVRIATGISATLTKSEKEAVTISASSEIYKSQVKTQVNASVLYIYYEEPKGASSYKLGKQPEKKLKASISYKALRKIVGEMGALVKHDSILKVEDFSVIARSGAIAKMRIDAKSLTAKLGEGSIVSVSGASINLKVTAETGSEFTGYSLSTQEGDIYSATGAMASITVTGKLKAKARTGGIVHYKGAPRELTKDAETDGIITAK